MTLAQRFAQVFGAVYLLVGILGAVPVSPILIGSFNWGPLSGLLLGLFAVNWFHSLAHFAIGVAGLATFRNPDAARYYALVVGVAYVLLFVIGLFGGPFGPLPYILPLNGLDNALHLLTAVIALAAFFFSQEAAGTPSPRV